MKRVIVSFALDEPIGKMTHWATVLKDLLELILVPKFVPRASLAQSPTPTEFCLSVPMARIMGSEPVIQPVRSSTSETGDAHVSCRRSRWRETAKKGGLLTGLIPQTATPTACANEYYSRSLPSRSTLTRWKNKTEDRKSPTLCGPPSLAGGVS
jgi:hypothetical protein